MKKIINWLKKHNIYFSFTDKGVNKYITITLEDAIWINGYNEEMKYQKYINIHFDTYKNYSVTECIGYNRFITLGKNTKADKIIDVLAKRFGVNE